MKKMMAGLVTLFVISTTQFTSATIVRFDTSMGTIDVNLYDELTPETVNNFLSYVNAEDYDNSIIHRSINNFIVQGGGFRYDGTLPLDGITEGSAVTNEPYFSNLPGTIAMAKLGRRPNSATNQWFFNLSDNSEDLDKQNGGFTVFGEVMLDDMDVVAAIADLPEFDFDGVFTDIPLRNYGVEEINNQTNPGSEHFVFVHSVRVVDATTNTAEGLSPTPNTLLTADTDSSGGGAIPIPLLIMMFAVYVSGRLRRNLV